MEYIVHASKTWLCCKKLPYIDDGSFKMASNDTDSQRIKMAMQAIYYNIM